MNLNSRILFVFVVGLGFGLGLAWRKSHSPARSPASAINEARSSFSANHSEKVSMPAARVSTVKETSSSLSAQRAREIEQTVESLEMPADEKSLWQSRNVNAWERKLKLALIAARHTDSIAGGEDLGTSYLADFRAHPEETMSAIRSLVPKLDVTSFPIDRASLLDVAASLPMQQSNAHALAVEEVNSVIAPVLPDPNKASSEADRDRILSTDPKALIPMVAEAVILRTSESESDAVRETLKAITSQQDPMLRNTLASLLTQKYPESKNEIVAALQKLGTAVTFDPSVAQGPVLSPNATGPSPGGEPK